MPPRDLVEIVIEKNTVEIIDGCNVEVLTTAQNVVEVFRTLEVIEFFQ